MFEYGSAPKIRQFACERDFYVFRNRMYKTFWLKIFESLILKQTIQYHAYKTFSIYF